MTKNKPKNWRRLKAEEICTKVTDGTHATPKRLTRGYPLITSKQLTGGKISTTDYFISKGDFKEVNKRSKVDQWDILFGMIGTIGEMVIVKDKNPGFVIKNIGLFKTGGNKVISKWLYYFFKSPVGKTYIKSVTRGTSQGYIPLESLRDFPIIIPEDTTERKKIISILSAFDDKIELNNKISQTLEQMAQATFKEWFIKNQKSKIKNQKKAEDIFIFEKGVEPGSRYYSETKKEDHIPFYRVRDLDRTTGVDVFVPEKIARGKTCKEDDVLLSLDATVGRVKIGCNGAFSSGIRRVYSKDGIIKNSFIYFWLKTSYVQNTILEHASGTTILHAGQSVKYLSLPFDKKVIVRMQTKIDPIFEKFLQIMKENQKLAALRDLLLPRLMRGETRV